jgi:hypothetical protein
MTKPNGHSRRTPQGEVVAAWSWTAPTRSERQLRRDRQARRLQAELRRVARALSPRESNGVDGA